MEPAMASRIICNRFSPGFTSPPGRRVSCSGTLITRWIFSKIKSSLSSTPPKAIKNRLHVSMVFSSVDEITAPRKAA